MIAQPQLQVSAHKFLKQFSTDVRLTSDVVSAYLGWVVTLDLNSNCSYSIVEVTHVQERLPNMGAFACIWVLCCDFTANVVAAVSLL